MPSMGDNACSGEFGKEMENAIKVLTKLDLGLGCSADKLLNLHILLMHLLALEDEFDSREVSDRTMKADFLEKSLRYGFLVGIVDSEVREVELFLDALPAEIDDAHHKICSCRRFGEAFDLMDEKLRKCQDILMQSREQVSEIKIHLAKLHRDFEALWDGKCDREKSEDLSEENPLFTASMRTRIQGRQPRHFLRLFEKSLARELALEKVLSESRQNEEDLKRKLHYTEQINFHIEEAAEVVWGRFLEAENAAEVLMGISKELAGRFQILQFNLSSSLQRETELKSKLDECLERQKEKDAMIENLESIREDYISKSAEVFSLRDRVKVLEEQLTDSIVQCQDANASCEANEKQIGEMENMVESMKEMIDVAENRAEAAEGKAAQLSDTNLELSEEINFLKGSVTSKSEKTSLLEKQLRDIEIQLQHAKVSSEASQEQQNMLYSAIWDMEVLIEDLKLKVSKAEGKTDAAEEQCIVLSEANFELSQEVSSLRVKIIDLETSLDEANKSRLSIADEISLRTKIMADTVMQLAFERERIQKQLDLLTVDDNTSAGNLEITKDSLVGIQGNGHPLNGRDYRNDTVNGEAPPKSVLTSQAG
ncbi:hypothetical protein MLD38_004363 [Melastoma candidum]|uniref:Uncharacterized protein n=1 Tax=Melastoma candidum TaxID=119954 RepID=A0ACB9S4P6_9MYRT|nr:hypothetical protein MLD38_004363 [Melastoma candidum]